MPEQALIVIGASAGGVSALTALVNGLPRDLPAAVCVVLHLPRTATSVLPRILSRAGALPAVPATSGAWLEAGCIYVAPPNWHMLIAGGRIHLTQGPSFNSNRPAIDPLFRTAARACGPRAIGVVLSGLLDDGTLGLRAIQAGGGAVLVQDPADALFDSMPLSALASVAADAVLPAAALGLALAEMARCRAALPWDEKGDRYMAIDMDDKQEAEHIAYGSVNFRREI